MLEAGEVDVFPTVRIVDVAGYVVVACLVGGSESLPTLGRERVCPRRVVEVTLKKRTASSGDISIANEGALFTLNGTGVVLMQNGVDQAVNITREG